MAETTQQMVERADKLGRKVAKIMHGQGPEVQGMTLVEMTAIWLAGHPPDQHDRLIKIHADAVSTLAAMLYAQNRKRRMT